MAYAPARYGMYGWGTRPGERPRCCEVLQTETAISIWETHTSHRDAINGMLTRPDEAGGGPDTN